MSLKLIRILTLFSILATFVFGDVPTSKKNVLNSMLEEIFRLRTSSIDASIANHGLLIDYHLTGNAGLKFDNFGGIKVNSVYQHSIWFAGKNADGNISAVVGDYTQDMAPGPYDGNPVEEQKIYYVDVEMLDNPSAHEDFQNWPIALGAPWVDVDGDGVYSPLPNGMDYPEFIGDRVVFLVSNDKSPEWKLNFGTTPTHLEFQYTVFSFDTPISNPLRSSLFYKVKIINKGEDLTDSYIGLWFDDDLGYAGDDLVGTDIERDMIFTYNDGNDSYMSEVNGNFVKGADFLQTPLIPCESGSAGKVIDLSSLLTSNPSGLYLKYEIIDYPNGALNENSNGIYTYVPPIGFVGNDQFTFRVSNVDGSVVSSKATVTIAVSQGRTTEFDETQSTEYNNFEIPRPNNQQILSNIDQLDYLSHNHDHTDENFIRCSTDELENLLQTTDPDFIKKRDAFIKKALERREEIAESKIGDIKIPIIFHYLDDGSSDVSIDAIRENFSQLNDDFRRENSDKNKIPSSVNPQSASLDPGISYNHYDKAGSHAIRFVGSKGEESADDLIVGETIRIYNIGNRTVSGVAEASTLAANTATVNGAPSGYQEGYLNIYIAPLANGLLGEAYLGYPEAVVRNKTVGSVASPNPSSSIYNLGRTLTHEIGHVFTYQHNFACDDCSSPIYSDIPSQTQPNYGNAQTYTEWIDYYDDLYNNSSKETWLRAFNQDNTLSTRLLEDNESLQYDLSVGLDSPSIDISSNLVRDRWNVGSYELSNGISSSSDLLITSNFHDTGSITYDLDDLPDSELISSFALNLSSSEVYTIADSLIDDNTLYLMIVEGTGVINDQQVDSAYIIDTVTSQSLISLNNITIFPSKSGLNTSKHIYHYFFKGLEGDYDLKIINSNSSADGQLDFKIYKYGDDAHVNPKDFFVNRLDTTDYQMSSYIAGSITNYSLTNHLEKDIFGNPIALADGGFYNMPYKEGFSVLAVQSQNYYPNNIGYYSFINKYIHSNPDNSGRYSNEFIKTIRIDNATQLAIGKRTFYEGDDPSTNKYQYVFGVHIDNDGNKKFEGDFYGGDIENHFAEITDAYYDSSTYDTGNGYVFIVGSKSDSDGLIKPFIGKFNAYSFEMVWGHFFDYPSNINSKINVLNPSQRTDAVLYLGGSVFDQNNKNLGLFVKMTFSGEIIFEKTIELESSSFSSNGFTNLRPYYPNCDVSQGVPCISETINLLADNIFDSALQLNPKGLLITVDDSGDILRRQNFVDEGFVSNRGYLYYDNSLGNKSMSLRQAGYFIQFANPYYGYLKRSITRSIGFEDKKEQNFLLGYGANNSCYINNQIGDQFMNYMDYVHDNQMVMFSKEQSQDGMSWVFAYDWASIDPVVPTLKNGNIEFTVSSECPGGYMFGNYIADSENMPISSSAFYINGDATYTDPADAEEAYNYLQGFRKDGSPYPNDIAGDLYDQKFVLWGDPNNGSHSTSNPLDGNYTPSADRRSLISVGPLNLAGGDSTEIVYNIFHAYENGNAFNSIKATSDTLQYQYDNKFEVLELDADPNESIKIYSGVTQGIAPLTINFSYDSSYEFNQYTWDFNGDGINDTSSKNPTYTFTQPGIYTVSLSAGYRYYKRGMFTYKNFSDSITITVEDPNNIFISDQSVITNEDTPIAIDLDISNKNNVDYQLLVEENPKNGTMAFNQSQVLYYPNPNFFGSDSLKIYAQSNNKNSLSATIYISVINIDDDPEATDFVVTLNEDTPSTIQLKANEYDGDTYTFEITRSVGHGVLSEIDGDSLVYSPKANWFGIDQFQYKAIDSSSKSKLGTVVLNVLPINDPPTTDDITVQTYEDQVTPINLSFEDIDGDALSLTYSSPTRGSLSQENMILMYTPEENFFGADSFTYAVNDNQVSSNTSQVLLTIAAVNDASENFQIISQSIANLSSSTNQEITTNMLLVTPENINDSLQLSWNPSFDVDGDNIRYQIVGKEGLEFLSTDEWFQGLSKSYALKDIIAQTDTLSTTIGTWMVKAYDGEYEVLSNEGEAVALSINGSALIPDKFTLYQNYPNPFTSSTTIKYDLKMEMEVEIYVYDLRGRKITTLLDETQGPGYRSIPWDGTSDSNENLSAGIYFIQLHLQSPTTKEKYIATKKITKVD